MSESMQTTATVLPSKPLTVGRIASARLRANKRAYLSLMSGILISVTMVALLCLCVQGMVLSRQREKEMRLGQMDCFVTAGAELTDVDLLKTGYFAELGHVYLTGEVEAFGLHTGWYDADGLRILNRVPTEGKMPERPGEVALEKNAHLLLCPDKQIGEEITLTIRPVDGVAETRTFTLTGLLVDQAAALDLNGSHNLFYSNGEKTDFPAIVFCEAEPAFATGRQLVHQVMKSHGTLALTAAFADPVLKRSLFAINAQERLCRSAVDLMPTGDLLTHLMWLISLGVALLLCCCIGIAGALESQLVRRSEEIGVMRALGATRRQIRRVFGRESYLLALLLSPLGVALGCAMMAVLAALFPNNLVFRPTIGLLVPIALLSALCVLVASALPLRRASRQMPVMVLKGGVVLRRPPRSRTQFSVPRLVSARQMYLHWTRQLGAAMLVALVMLVTTLVYTGATVSYDDDESASWYINQGRSMQTGLYNVVNNRTMSAADLRQLSALPQVSRVGTTREYGIHLLMEEAKIPQDYFAQTSDRGYYFLPEETALAKQRQEEEERLSTLDAENQASVLSSMREGWRGSREIYDETRARFQIEQAMVPFKLNACVLKVEKLAPYVVSGKIDLDAINRGEQVILYMPDIWKNRGKDTITTSYGSNRGSPEEVTLAAKGGLYQAGETFELAQLIARDLNQEEVTIERASVTVGAVLDPEKSLWEMDDSTGMFNWPCLITTAEGAEAMGLSGGTMIETAIYTSGAVDEKTEAYLQRRIEAIALREEGSRVYNALANARKMEEQRRVLTLALACVMALFFVMSVAMVVGSVSRRVQADSRMIGMLRAVGADRRTIAGCYSGQISLSVGLGAALGVALWALLVAVNFYGPMSFSDMLPPFLLMMTLAALCCRCCQGMLRLRIREVTKRSMIENIREM